MVSSLKSGYESIGWAEHVFVSHSLITLQSYLCIILLTDVVSVNVI